jgi:RNA polymerase sigma factor (sigma-70 family)
VNDEGERAIMGDMVSLGRRTPSVGLTRRTPAHEESREFREIFQAVYPRLVRTVWFVVHDHELAQEIAQEAFIDLHRQWRTVGSYERPDLWVRRVALRKAQREAARSVRRIHAEQQAAVTETAGPADADLPDPALRAALATLPPMQRAVVALFYLEDRPMEEVADLLGCSPSTGFVHLHRARHRLAALLSEPVTEEVDGHVD